MADIFLTVSAVVGIASGVCKVLEVGARVITPNNPKDDLAVSKLRRFVTMLQNILAYPALNPKK